MTGFVLKIIALITMVLDHIKYAIPTTRVFLTIYFGRISFPLFAFLITEGYVHTKSKRKYIKRLVILAILSEIPHMLFTTLLTNQYMINVIFTFLLAILGIEIFEHLKNNEKMNKIIRYIIIAISFLIIAILGEYINVSYGWFGIITVWIFYIFKSSKIVSLLIYTFAVILYYYSHFPSVSNKIVSIIFTIIPGILIWFYNGKEGRKIKYLFYIFYPLHMAILYVISLIL